MPDKLQGSVYVLQSNPPELKLLVAASADGVNLKLVGTVHLNEATGQLTTTFENTPDAPFSEFKLAFSGGAQAALVTPPTCGVKQTTAAFSPWSSPFVPEAFDSTLFAITAGPGGSACMNPMPFSPTLTAGSTTGPGRRVHGLLDAVAAPATGSSASRASPSRRPRASRA